MSISKFVVCRFAVIAAVSALLAGCGGGDVSSALVVATPAGATVRTPLVDDEGLPMPADPEPADVAPAAAAEGRATP